MSRTFVDDANRQWTEIRDRIRAAAPRASGASLEIALEGDVELPFAYVPTTIDVLLDVGVREVTFVTQGLHLSLAEPQPCPVERREGRPGGHARRRSPRGPRRPAAFALTGVRGQRRRRGSGE